MKVMKKIFVAITCLICGFGASGQVRYPNFPDTQLKIIYENGNAVSAENVTSPLDSNTEYRQVKDAVVMQGGQPKMVRNGILYPLNSAVTLKNGSIVMTDGIIKMTNGATPILKEGDLIDMDGNIKPLQARMGNTKYLNF
jgi:hypothetical protein